MSRRPFVHRATTLALLLATASAWAGAARAAAAAEQSAADLLPASTLFYAEVGRPKDVIGLALDHPLMKQLQQAPEYRQAMETPQFRQFREVVALVEQRAVVRWRPALETITGGGAVVAFEPSTQGVVVLVRSEDPKTTERVRDAVLSLAREDAKNKGQPDPVQTKAYRGLTGYRIGENRMVGLGPWLLVSNKPRLATAVADTFLDAEKGEKGEQSTLAQDAEFVAARDTAAKSLAGETEPAAWAFVRLAPLKLLGALAGVNWLNPQAKSDNPGAEFLAGGLISTIQKAPYVTAAVAADQKNLKIAVSSPYDPAWVPEQRKFYFAPAEEGGGAAKPLKPKGTLLSVTAYRDVGAFWQAGPDLFTEGVAAQLAQQDSQLSTFMGGKSFGTDVLGAIKPQMQFVVARQDFKTAGVPEPTIKLPAFAWVFRLKKAEAREAQIRKHFKVAFESIIALGNLDGASKNRPLLDPETEKRGAATIHYAVYEQEPADPDAPAGGAEGAGGAHDAPAAGDPPAAVEAMKPGDDMHLNFSPALVVSDHHLILCSTKQLADELADLAAQEKPGATGAAAAAAAPTYPHNTIVEVDGGLAAELLKENREQLIAQNMLEKGHSPEAAAKEIDLLLALVGYFRDSTLRLTPTDKAVTLEWTVRTAK